MKRRALIQGLAALAVAGSAEAGGAKPVTPGFFRVVGPVRINGQPAQEGMPVRPGDTVTTGPGAEAIYVIGQDAYLQRGNSTVDILADAVKGGLRVITGRLLAVFAKGERRIETATATIGIRGTGCYLESEPGRVYFCLCYGKADLTPLAAPDQRETIATTHHDHPLYILGNGQQAMVPAAVENHSDSELILLEGLVGRVPPFSGSALYSSRY